MTTIARNRTEAEVYITDVIDKLGGGTITQPLLDSIKKLNNFNPINPLLNKRIQISDL